MEQNTAEDYSESGGFPEFSFVSTSEEAHSVIEEYEIRTTSRFSCYVAKKGFGNTDFYDDTKKLKVMWEDYHDNNSKSLDTKGWRLEFDGVPYLSLSWKKFDCHHGQDRKEKSKMSVGPDTNKRGQVTKKLGCPARIILREVLKFPELKITQDTHWYRHEASRKLRSAIKSKTAVGERRIYIYLPKISDHKQHLTGAAGGITQRLDSRIKLKIQQLNAEGQSNVDNIRKELHHFVENELFVGSEPPPMTNRRFYPTKTDIRNHLNLARKKQEKSTTLTAGISSNALSPPSTRIRRSYRKRKLHDSVDHESIASYSDENVSVLPSNQTNIAPLLDSCPDHITEVEISSQETMDATKAIEETVSVRTVEVNTIDPADGTEVLPISTDFVSETKSISSKYQVTIREIESTDTIGTDHHSEPVSFEESPVPTVIGTKPPQSTKDLKPCLEEPQSEFMDASTVVDNLNLIAQAMEERMSESSNRPSYSNSKSSPNSIKTVAMTTGRTSQSSSVNNKKQVGARCRSLLGQVKQLTDLVQDTDVLETVQDKLLDLVSFMENHVPLTQEQKNTPVNDRVIQIAGAEAACSAPEVMNIEIVNFEMVM